AEPAPRGRARGQQDGAAAAREGETHPMLLGGQSALRILPPLVRVHQRVSTHAPAFVFPTMRAVSPLPPDSDGPPGRPGEARSAEEESALVKLDQLDRSRGFGPWPLAPRRRRARWPAGGAAGREGAARAAAAPRTR